MDTLSAFAMGEAHREDRARVFDWVRAATLIVERQPVDETGWDSATYWPQVALDLLARTDTNRDLADSEATIDAEDETDQFDEAS